MSTIELSVATTYRPNWKLWEGVREIVQNYLDGKDWGYDGPITYIPSSGTLRTRNEGATLTSSDIALLGETSKADDPNSRGQFGDGLKIGMLALVRERYKVTIRSGNTRWTARLQKSRKFGREVLTLQSAPTTYFNGVEVKVSEISEEQWNLMRGKFLDLRDPDNNILSSNRDTDILTSPQDRGNIYVKGIYVQHNKDLQYGYNFKHGVKVDIDRNMVNSFDLKWHASEALVSNIDTIGIDKIFELVASGADDAQFVSNWLGEQNKNLMSAKFTELYGQNSVPVQRAEESTQLEHYGLNGVVVSNALIELLKDTDISKEKQLTARQNDSTEIPWRDLTEVQQQNVLRVYSKFHSCKIPFNQNQIKFVVFNNPDKLGTYTNKDTPVIQVSTAVLDSPRNLTKTLVEEIAHQISNAGDGSYDHKMALHNIYLSLVYGPN